MKISFTKAISLSALLISTFSLKAQNHDYVIMINGDTVKCVISSRIANRPVNKYKYKTDDRSVTKKVDEENIKEFHIADSNVTFRAMFHFGYKLPLFMKVVEKGKISLYEKKEIYSHTSSFNMPIVAGDDTVITWYVAKGITDTVKPLKTYKTMHLLKKNQQEDNLAEMILDNPDVYNLYIVDNKFSFKKVRNIIHLYNTGQPFKETEKEKEDNTPADFNPNPN